MIFLIFAFLYSAYTANVVSLLQSPSKNIKTMEDLFNSKLKLGAEDTPYNRHYFSTTKNPFERKVYLDKLAPPGKKDNFLTAKEGISRVRNGLYAFVVEETTAFSIMENTFFEHEKCELVSIEYLKFTDPFIMIRKRSPYKEILKIK